MPDHFIFYLESNIVCFIIFGIMLVHDLLGVDRQEKQIKFDRALIMFMLYFVADAFWAGFSDGVLPKNFTTVAISNLLDYVLLSGITYAWLEFVMALEQVPNRNRKLNKFAIVFPFLISTLALAVVFIISPGLLFGESLEPRPAFYAFLTVVPCINIGAVMVYTVRKAVREENPTERKRHLFIGIFPLVVVLGGALEVNVLPNIPIFCFCAAVLMIMMYIQSIETQISTDPLTKLNNRGQLSRYISQKNNYRLKDRVTYVIMLDINSFKKINDTFGHAEGDDALTIIADSIKEKVRLLNAPVFMCRYGGDEFLIIIHPENEENLELFIGDVRSDIENRCRSLRKPYVLSVGVGYEKLMDDPDTIQECMVRADKNLYIDKKSGSGSIED